VAEWGSGGPSPATHNRTPPSTHQPTCFPAKLEPRVGQLKRKAPQLRHGKRSVPVIDAIATANESGNRWAIALINRHPSERVACTVEMGGKLLDGIYPATILTADSPDAYNDIATPNRVTPKKTELQFRKGIADLPPHSLVIVRVRMKTE
jgi:alpha-N-arabinofuranosidase